MKLKKKRRSKLFIYLNTYLICLNYKKKHYRIIQSINQPFLLLHSFFSNLNQLPLICTRFQQSFNEEWCGKSYFCFLVCLNLLYKIFSSSHFLLDNDFSIKRGIKPMLKRLNLWKPSYLCYSQSFCNFH